MRPTILHSFARSKGLSIALPGMALVAVLAGCDGMCPDKDCMFTETEWDLVKGMSPLPDPPPDPTNRFVGDLRAETLGHKLLFETRYSTALKVASTLGGVGDTGKVACESCHKAMTNFVDTRSMPNNMSVGVSWTLRNAPMLVNTVYYTWHNWAGNRRALWEQAGGSPETGTNTAGDRCTYAHMLWDHYHDEYNALFTDAPLPERLDPTSTDPIPTKCKPSANPTTTPGPWEAMAPATQFAVAQVMCNQGKAVAAFETTLISRNAPFDAYVAGTGDISVQAKRGLKLFVTKAACANCHLGPFFTDQKFHNLGVSQAGDNVPATDQGRIEAVKELPTRLCKAEGPFSDSPSVNWLDGVVEDTADLGRFRTGSLRNVTESAPYMHTGGFASLRDVITFYNHGGEDAGFVGIKDPRIRPLGLTESEIDDLIAFLETLTGEPLPADLTAVPQLPP